jgi:peptidyl-prolyl cis-trans isomerase A (cyclophilin A)
MFMRRFFGIILALCLAASAIAQTAPATPAKKSPAKRATGATPAKPRTPGAATAAAARYPKAIIQTTAGNFRCTLFPDKAPIGVENFIGLAEGTKDWKNPVSHAQKHGVPLYEGTIFHRVIPNFMIQGGDPKGDGTGDPGYAFKNETSPDLKFDRPGRLAYANAGPGTNGSQFFITEVPYPSLNGGYTIFGQCDEPSVELVKRVARLPRNSDDRPNNPPRITKVTIVKPGAAAPAAAPGAKKPAAKKPLAKKPAAKAQQ